MHTAIHIEYGSLIRLYIFIYLFHKLQQYVYYAAVPKKLECSFTVRRAQKRNMKIGLTSGENNRAPIFSFGACAVCTQLSVRNIRFAMLIDARTVQFTPNLRHRKPILEIVFCDFAERQSMESSVSLCVFFQTSIICIIIIISYLPQLRYE